MSVAAVEACVSHSRWTPGQQGVERGKARRYVRLAAKVAESPGEWRKIELTFARYNVDQFTRVARWVKPDGSARDAGEWFHLARKHRLVGEFKKRLERELGCKLEYFKAAEFQEDGFLHYHVLIRVTGRRKKKAMIGHDVLTRLWGWGVVWERPVDGKAVAYASKGVAYAAKGVGAVPDYMRGLTSLTKLTSTSRGFYPPGERKPAKPKPLKPRKRCIPPIGFLLDYPRSGFRTKLKLVDGLSGQECVREIKGGDIYTLLYVLGSMGFETRTVGCSRVQGVRPGPVPPQAARPSLVQYQHCGVSDLLREIGAALDETERLLQ